MIIISAVCKIFFQLVFGCHMFNFGPLSGRQPHSPDVYHLRFTYSARGVTGSLVAKLGP